MLLNLTEKTSSHKLSAVILIFRVAETTVISISLEQLKVKEPTNDNLTQRTTLNSGLQFLDIPKGDDLKIIELQLENGFLLFEAFSSLMGYLLPREFPIGKLPFCNVKFSRLNQVCSYRKYLR